MLHLLPVAALSMVLATERTWDVTVHRPDVGPTTLRVNEQEPLLTAVERAGFLPGSDCRRGNCLSCAARVVDGAPFSLRVSGCTALCTEAHSMGLVLLCSAYAVGPGVELALGYEGEAWDVQHAMRWRSDAPAIPPLTPESPHFRLPEDSIILLERCSSIPAARNGDGEDGAEEPPSSSGVSE